MLEEYIVAQLKQVQSDIRELKQKLQNLSDEEVNDQNRMNQLISKADIGLELFSPRSIDTKVKETVEEIRKHIDRIQYEENAITEEIDKQAELEKKWQTLLEEAKQADQKPRNTVSDSENKQFQDEMDVLLTRIDRCITLLPSDRIACEKELNGIRYYVMALKSSRT